MSVILVFLLVIFGIAGWWLSQQGLMSRPWLETGAGAVEPTGMPTAKVGLGVFLAVVGCLFALFASAYFMRMELADWRAMPLPRLVWLNTGMLVLGSVALQSARVAARAGQIDTARLGLATGGVAGFAFLTGQVMAWRELVAAGYVVDGNPADSFFYLLTGVHGLHIMGGLVALGWTMSAAWSVSRSDRLPLRAELCAMYAHFLLFVWLGILVLLAGWASDVIEICRQLLT
ncbi:MAG: cytochrome c oxidase subunit 3 [Rhodobacteraceae bacterium]|nr:cytochrome c oxidase subunit 3 [Paracoccaceae bacterium]